MSRSVLITGGNRGIGLAIARAFAAEGDKVAVTYRSSPPPDAGLLALPCDVTSTEQVDAAFTAAEAAHGPVEILVANAGITQDTLLPLMSDEAFDSVIDTNLGGAFRVARRASRKMLRARRGRIVFISSVVGATGGAGQANYAASKAGLVGLARSIARELGPRGITANVVAPGLVTSDMTAVLSEERHAAILARMPSGRATEPDEIARTVVYLASEAAATVNGSVLTIDGGLSAGTS
ncbi:3-oxoacyl-ACP reductase FabG [Streptomyces sp. ISL-98]|uniref:3-oxoacyl-ACP reductase FabG n=1 Tax=Streptomyces sp. ISL-98 TaxID=2819192 RepID=UPI001BE526FF|nr:3-oxoacyl-ACP reductase FabG [Streptomyces sp. ISL-98]MBT2505939.1 3-oxoacyl-ACP reductase FabG [Streptomyces sp. ISL-98]